MAGPCSEVLDKRAFSHMGDKWVLHWEVASTNFLASMSGCDWDAIVQVKRNYETMPATQLTHCIWIRSSCSN